MNVIEGEEDWPECGVCGGLLEWSDERECWQHLIDGDRHPPQVPKEDDD